LPADPVALQLETALVILIFVSRQYRERQALQCPIRHESANTTESHPDVPVMLMISLSWMSTALGLMR